VGNTELKNCKLQTKKKRLLELKNVCELCGDARKLDVHHIIPKSLGGSDDLDNLIVVCGKCHGVLTPKSELTKCGLRRARSEPVVSASAFYAAISERLDAGDSVGPCEIMDVFDSLVFQV